MFNRREFWGGVIILIGLIFLLDNLEFINYSTQRFIHNLWPIILVIIGIALIIRHSGQKGKERYDKSKATYQPDGTISRSVSRVFDDMYIETKGLEIDGMDYSLVFGDMTLNLSEAKLKEGVNHIYASTVFGDITVIIPAGMEVKAYGSNTFGDLYILGRSASGISKNLTRQTDGYDTAASKIYLSATTTFGDIKIYKS